MKNLFYVFIAAILMTACSKDEGGQSASNLPAEFQSLNGIFNGQGIGAATNIGDDIILFFSLDGQSYAWYEENEIKRTARLDEEDGLFDGYALGTVGAAIDFEEEQLVFFNKSGGVYQWADIDPDAVVGASLNDSLIEFSDVTWGLSEWGIDDSCPFDDIGAMMGFSKFPEGCNIVEDDDLYLWMISDDGDALTRYVKEDTDFDDDVDLELWRSENLCGGSPVVFPMQSIGAACIYEDDIQSVQLFFSNSGKQMTIFNPSTGMYSEVFNI